ncbi:MAG: hypothetical protein IH899_11735, partial [Planctomycetes bacterium]|nr:hypothetical protein [Planctomycetota bacterium]
TSNDGWRRLAAAEIGGWEFLEFVTADTSLAEWFDFRSRVIAQGTGELLDIAKEVRGPDFPFGADSYPPSVSFIGGHRLGRPDF